MLTIECTFRWAPIYINGEKTKYMISTNGLVINTNTNKYLTNVFDKDGYPYVCLFHNGKRYQGVIHRLMAKVFIPNPYNKPEVNHIDGIKYNTVLSNLEMVTTKENIQHAIDTGLHNYFPNGEDHVNSKYKTFQIEQVCLLLSKNKYTKKQISKITNVPLSTITDILKGKGWKHISINYDIKNFNTYERDYVTDDIKKKIYTLSKRGYRNIEIMDKLGWGRNDKNHAIIKRYKYIS